MTQLSGKEKSRYVQEMFARIAHRYDLMNRIMTIGQDVRWRREVIRRAAITPGAYVLDLGSGTGDLTQEVRFQHPNAIPIAADFTVEMMRAGQTRSNGTSLNWCAANALNLPFPNETFDATISGFLMRNVSDLPHALREQHRTLKAGGRIVILDTTRPPDNLLTPLIQFHLQTIIPWLGSLIAGDAEAYTYLPDSTQDFLKAERLAREMEDTGFQEVGYRKMMFGTVAIHWGRKGSAIARFP